MDNSITKGTNSFGSNGTNTAALVAGGSAVAAVGALYMSTASKFTAMNEDLDKLGRSVETIRSQVVELKKGENARDEQFKSTSVNVAALRDISDELKNEMKEIKSKIDELINALLQSPIELDIDIEPFDDEEEIEDNRSKSKSKKKGKKKQHMRSTTIRDRHQEISSEDLVNAARRKKPDDSTRNAS